MNSTERILSFFEEINKVPRKSGNRGPITDWLQAWGREKGYETDRDEMDNLVIRVPGTPGYEKAPVVVLQGHSDMVCEKTPESDHDFTKDPVRLVHEGDWLRGDDTTLGADNGIAIALAMELATADDAEHPPLEILVTSDEEIGLVGANALKPGFVKGRILLNLDSEDEGIFTIGCAGGADSRFSVPVVSHDTPKSRSYRLTVGGLKGGHSGMDINDNLGNALKMIQRVLSDVSGDESFLLASLNAGSGASNAICRDARADFVISEHFDIQAVVSDWAAKLKGEYSVTEEDLYLNLKEIEAPLRVLDAASTRKILQVVRLIPHGVSRMSDAIEDLVQTSSNLAWTEISPEGASFLTSQRSAVMSELRDMNLRMEDLALLAGGSCDTLNKYPSWEPNTESALLKKSLDVYRAVTGKEPVVEAIHAGLECGLIGDTYAGMDMISIGPTIKHPHTPEERLYVPSLEPFREFLAALLKSFKA
jgi:dipeptidase D